MTAQARNRKGRTTLVSHQVRSPASDECADQKLVDMWAREKYDAILARHPEGITWQDACDILAESYVQAVRSGDIPRVC